MGKAITSRYDASGRMILDNAGGRVVVPGVVIPSGGSSSNGGVSSPAAIASTVAGLGTPSAGKLGIIRVGTWPDVEYVELFYDDVAGKWVSRPKPLIQMTDQSYMGVNTTAYSYIGQNTSGTTSGSIGWTTRSIRRVSQLLAAGLKLQAKFSAILSGSSAPAILTAMPFFFQNNDNENVVFSSDGSAAIGWLGTAMVSPNSSQPTFRSLPWQDILKNGLGTTLAAADVTKANLWPRLYAKVASGVTYGQIIDADLQYRWSS